MLKGRHALPEQTQRRLHVCSNVCFAEHMFSCLGTYSCTAPGECTYCVVYRSFAGATAQLQVARDMAVDDLPALLWDNSHKAAVCVQVLCSRNDRPAARSRR